MHIRGDWLSDGAKNFVGTVWFRKISLCLGLWPTKFHAKPRLVRVS